MDLKTGHIVTNTGIMVFIINFYEGQKKDIKKYSFGLQRIIMILL